MNIKDLRIGNWIELSNSQNVQIICIRHDNLISYWEGDFDFIYNNIRDFNSIPLTEEWLIKFGILFNKNEGYKFTSNTHLQWCSFEIGTYLRLYAELDEIPLTNEIKYVHELQNLYFSITREELEIK